MFGQQQSVYRVEADERTRPVADASIWAASLAAQFAQFVAARPPRARVSGAWLHPGAARAAALAVSSCLSLRSLRPCPRLNINSQTDDNLACVGPCADIEGRDACMRRFWLMSVRYICARGTRPSQGAPRERAGCTVQE